MSSTVNQILTCHSVHYRISLIPLSRFTDCYTCQSCGYVWWNEINVNCANPSPPPPKMSSLLAGLATDGVGSERSCLPWAGLMIRRKKRLKGVHLLKPSLESPLRRRFGAFSFFLFYIYGLCWSAFPTVSNGQVTKSSHLGILESCS